MSPGQARAAGATDLEIHDTVLIAAVFGMYNRYVDGLATIAPEDPALYAAGAQRLIEHGYLPPALARQSDLHFGREVVIDDQN